MFPRKLIALAVIGATIAAGVLAWPNSGAAQSGGRSPETKLTASDAAAFDNFGVSVAIDGDTVVVGAPSDDDAGVGSGSAYVFVDDESGWTEQAKLTASDAASGDRFGYIAISGDTIVVGAPGDRDAGPWSGSAYVFGREGSTWTDHDKLTASDGGAYDRFGWSVSISGDTIAIGARGSESASLPDEGAQSSSAYVFSSDGTGWSEQAKLTASDAEAGDQFGHAAAMSGDTVVVGAPYDDKEGLGFVSTDSGSAYVYEVVFCQGHLATYLGTDGDDDIEGTAGRRDVIHGLGGNDVIRGLGGNDVICGGDGDDEIHGNFGRDRLDGGAGNDAINGGLGSDIIHGGVGNDWVAGGWGDGATNWVSGGAGDDVVFGGDGDDLLWGGGGYDLLYGGSGDDLLQGNHRWDLLRGGPGNDILYGDQQNPDPANSDPAGDHLFGDEGDDQLFGQEGDDDLDGGPDTDSCDGGPGTNTVINCE